MAMYILRQGRRAVRMAAVPSVSSGPRHGSSKPLPLRLQSCGDVPSSIPQEPPGLVPVSQGLACPRGLQDTGWALGPPGPGRQALSYGDRLGLEASVTAALISSPSGS